MRRHDSLFSITIPQMDEYVQPAGSSDCDVDFEPIKARYAGLVALWTHRDATMHRWPPLIITATGALGAVVFSRRTPQELKEIVDVANWGVFSEFNVWLATGIPLLIGGLSLLPLIYAMGRALIIMNQINDEIVRLEQTGLHCPPNATFAILNHPGGWSSRKLIRRALSAIAFTLIAAGCLFVFGLRWGVCAFLLIIGTSILFEQSYRFRPR